MTFNPSKFFYYFSVVISMYYEEYQSKIIFKLHRFPQGAVLGPNNI